METKWGIWRGIKVNMSYKGWLSVALKVVGVLTLVNGIVQAIVTWGSAPAVGGMIPPLAFLSSMVVPIVMMGAGLYLIMGTHGLVERISIEEDENAFASWFMLAMKVLGVVLIVEALPYACRIVSNAIQIYSISPAWSTEMQNRFIFENLLSTLVKAALGCYLLVGGKWVQQLAFPPVKEME